MDVTGLATHFGRTVFSSSSPWARVLGYRARDREERREIQGMIFPNDVESSPLSPDQRARTVRIGVANDPELGVEFPAEGDIVDMAIKEGGDVWWFEVVEVIDDSGHGRWNLLCEGREPK